MSLHYRHVMKKRLSDCFKNGTWSAAVLLPVRFVGPLLIPQGGTRNGPSRGQPKSLAAAQFRFFKPSLSFLPVCLFPFALMAQTNSYQGFHPGENVRIEAPFMVLGSATIKTITTSNLTVISHSKAFGDEPITFALTNIQSIRAVRQPASDPIRFDAGSQPKGYPAASGAVTSSVPATVVSNPKADKDAGMAFMSKYSDEPGYTQALSHFQQTADGVLAGTKSLQDMRDQAANVLKAVDQFVPERQRDPEFDAQIDQLRDFVKRVDAGEKITQ
jgi:hypothetical protein